MRRAGRRGRHAHWVIRKSRDSLVTRPWQLWWVGSSRATPRLWAERSRHALVVQVMLRWEEAHGGVPW